MDSKLTLSVDKSLAEKAKLYAHSQGRSLSDLVESYFRVLTTNTPSSDIKVSSKLKAMKGSIALPDEFNYKEALSNELLKKHSK